MKIIDGGLSVDDRGIVTFVNDFSFEGVKRFYMVQNHQKGFVRAWHGHRKEAKYVFVTQGSILLATRPIDGMGNEQPLDRVVLSAVKPQIAYIPPGLFNGFKTMTDDAQVMFFSTSTVEESSKDDIREPASDYAWTWEIDAR